MSSHLKTTITPRYAINSLVKSMSIGLVPMLWGSPGIGKSASVAQIAKNYNLELLDIRVSNYEPVDFAGLPDINEDKTRATYLPFDLIPLEGDPLPEGKDGWLIFFDEINHGKKSTVAAMYKILLDKKVGNHRIHQNVMMVAAGNSLEDRALVEVMSTATKSRLCNLYMVADVDQWLEDVAMKNNYDYRIISYLSEFKYDFYNFAPEENQDSFCCPRSWSQVNDLLTVNEGVVTLKDDLPIIGGLLSPDVASKFITYCNLVEDMVPFKDIIANPTNAKIPENQSLLWASITSMVTNVDQETIAPVMEYIKRVDKSFAVLFIRMLNVQKPLLGRDKQVTAVAMQLGKYFRGE